MKSKFEKREEAIFGSFDGLQPAEVPPYFYTRLIARMQNELVERKPVFLLRPAFLTVSLSIFLVFNIVFLFQFNGRQKTSFPQSNNTATIESFADAYNLNTSSVYE